MNKKALSNLIVVGVFLIVMVVLFIVKLLLCRTQHFEAMDDINRLGLDVEHKSNLYAILNTNDCNDEYKLSELIGMHLTKNFDEVSECIKREVDYTKDVCKCSLYFYVEHSSIKYYEYDEDGEELSTERATIPLPLKNGQADIAVVVLEQW